LLTDLLELLRVPSVSGDEEAMADVVEARLRACRWLEVVRLRHCVVARTAASASGRLLLAGHVDTVRPTDPPQAVARAGDAVTGRGAVDMKGGVAVLLRLAETVAADPATGLTFVLYDREETGSHGSGMRLLADERPDLLAADAAVLLEPTGGWAELGCQGNLGLRATFDGRAAHTARPWQGVNAVRLAAPAIARCAGYEVRPEVVDGHTYPQALEIVRVEAGTGVNVVPQRCVVDVNVRYAPNRSRDAVAAEVGALLDGADGVEITLDSPAAMPSVDAPLLRGLLGHPSVASRPKLGWTDVGRLAQLGVPAVNIGPGDPELAHGPAEVVSGAELAFVYDRLAELVRP
jgi:succinyl-diaminopimelate desuccinylase